MSALFAPPHLSLELQQERQFSADPSQQCRFCHCCEVVPCMIPVREDLDGKFYLAHSEQEATLILACAWFVPGVCSAPECMAKLYAELKGELQFISF
jgi:hypothetical protein